MSSKCRINGKKQVSVGPSIVRWVAVYIGLSLLLAITPPPTYAGQWVLAQYNLTGTDNNIYYGKNYSLNWGLTDGTFQVGTYGGNYIYDDQYRCDQCDCAGKVQAVFCWIPQNGDVPGSDTFQVFSYARASNDPDYDPNYEPDWSLTCSADNGFGDGASGDPYASAYDADSYGVHIVTATQTKDSNGVYWATLPTLSAYAHGGGSDGDDDADSTELFFNFSPTNISVQIGGSTLDSQNNSNVIIGQLVDAWLTLPALWTASNYHWTVQGETESSFYLSPAVITLGVTTTPAQAQGYPVPVPAATWQTAAPDWFWSDNGANWGHASTDNVSVTATLTDPNGNTYNYASPQIPVLVWAPTVNVLNQAPQTSCVWSALGLITCLSSSPNGSPDAPGTPGMYYDVQVVDPDSPVFNSKILGANQWGKINAIQLTDFSASAGPFANCTTNGETWLDNEDPYNTTGEAGSTIGPPYAGYLNFQDSPYIPANGVGTTSAQANCTFQDYIMYTPPGIGSNAVPVYEVDWNWIAAASVAFGQSSPPFITSNPFGTSITSSQYQYHYPVWWNILIPFGS